MEPLSDPSNDRMVQSISPPPHHTLTHEILFPNGSAVPDHTLLQSHLDKEGRLSKSDFLQLVSSATALFHAEPNLLALQDPVTVVGDIHGQYYDLTKILSLGGDFTATKYLLLGDYVDRGAFSIEVITLLFALKINYPSIIHMIRGNHECRHMTSYFNFRTECLYKYDIEVFDRIMECFDCLPLACIVNDRFIGVHGGISPELRTLEDIHKINRFSEPPRSGLFCDMLWSDPVSNAEGKLDEGYTVNKNRGCSYFYGANVVNNFLRKNNLISVIRAHEVQIDGYKMHRWNGDKEFPTVITLFSAPNYCDIYNNKGAIIKFDNSTLNIQQYTYNPHPYLLPNFMNVFTWSLPFVIEKVMLMLNNILKGKPSKNSNPEDTGLVKQLHEEQKKLKKEALRNKVKSVSRMIKMFKNLREDNEVILMLGGICPDNRLPVKKIINERSALDGVVESFSQAQEVDAPNERLPENLE